MLLKIRPEDRVEGTIGKETAANIGRFFKDQYERIPEDRRKGFEQGVSEAATGIQEWNKQLREENYHGGIGPLDPFIAAGKAYNFVAEPIKKELSIQTGLAPEWIEAGEVAVDFLLPAIPLTAASKGKKLKKAVDYTNALNVLDDTTKLNNKIRKILATNSNYSYGKARELALLELKGIHPTRKLYPDRPDRGGLMDGAPIDEQSMWNAQQNKPIVDSKDGYSYRKGRQLKNPIYDNLSPKVQKQFTEAGIDSDNAKFFIEEWTREVGATVEGFPFTDRTFDFMKSELLPKVLRDLKGVDLSDGLQLDHIAQLKAMTPFYQGRNLKQAEKIRRILIKEGIFGGHNPKNLKYLPTDVHTVKTNFWKQNVGDAGEKFFEGRKMRTYADVERAAKEMKVFIDRSNKIVENLSVQYKLMRGKNISNDELWKLLQKVDLNKGPYNLKDVRKLIDEIDADYDAGNVPSALGGKSQSPPTQVQQVKSVSPKQQSLNKLKELRKELKDNKKKYNKDEITQMKADIKKLADELEGKQKSIFNRTGL